MYGEYVCLPSWLVSAWKSIYADVEAKDGMQLFPELSADECDAFLLLLQGVQNQLVSGECRPTLSKNNFLRHFSASRESQRRHGTRLFDFISSFGLRRDNQLQKLFSGELSFEDDGDCHLKLELSEKTKDSLLGFSDAFVQTDSRVFSDESLVAQQKHSGKNWYLSRILWGDLSARERMIYCLFAEYLQGDGYYVQWDGAQAVPLNKVFDRSFMNPREFHKTIRLISRKMEEHGHLAEDVDLQFPFYPKLAGEIGLFLKLHAEHSRSFAESRHKSELGSFIHHRRLAWLEQGPNSLIDKTLGFVSASYGCPDLAAIYKKSFEVLAGDCSMLELPRAASEKSIGDSQLQLLLCHPLDLAIELLARKEKNKGFELADQFDLGSVDSVCRFAVTLEKLYKQDFTRWKQVLPKNLWFGDRWNPEMIRQVRDSGRPRSLQKKEQPLTHDHKQQSFQERPGQVEARVSSRRGASAKKPAAKVPDRKQQGIVTPSKSSMISKARRELGGLRRNDYQHYEKLRAAYVESLDPSTLEIVKEMQKRLPRDLFDDQLGDRISHFMIENPHLWKTRVKPVAYS